MANPTASHPNHDRNFLIALAVMFILLISFATCEAQVIYSSWSSAQVKHAVEIEKPVLKRDTVTDISGPHIQDRFEYKGFTIYLEFHRKYSITIVSGTMVIILKPDDEYEVIEKLLNLK